MAFRTTTQLQYIKTLIIQNNADWAKDNNVIITEDDGRMISGMGMGQPYVVLSFDNGTKEPTGDGLLFVRWTLGVGVHYGVNIDQSNRWSTLTTRTMDYAEKIINTLHMCYDSNWVEPIKLETMPRIEVDKETGWAIAKLKFNILQVESFMH